MMPSVRAGDRDIATWPLTLMQTGEDRRGARLGCSAGVTYGHPTCVPTST